MNSNSLVTIMIPCYNHEAFLGDCLSSILAQDYENVELLICDDCSPDNSYAVITSFEERLKRRFSRVEIMRNDVNCGVTKNINRMLRMAQGVYVKTIASDDAMAPNAISSMVSYLEKNPEVSVVVSNGVKVPEEQHYPEFSSKEKIYVSAPDFSRDGLFERVARCNEISAPAAMVRMSVYREYGLYDETVKVEDYEFWLRILKEGNTRIGFLDKDLLFYRINANSMSSLSGNAGLARRRKIMHQSEIESLNKYCAYFTKEAYAQIVLDRILDERGFAIIHRLPQWEKELREELRSFSKWKDLPAGDRLSYRIRSIKQSLRKLLNRM